MSSSKNKTQPTRASVSAYIAAIPDGARRADCRTVLRLLRKITGEVPRMWGPSIVGFGTYHYRYESGREGDSLVVGFSSRKPDISVYFSTTGPRHTELLASLGKHKMAKACLSMRKLDHVNIDVLATMLADAVAESKRRYGNADRVA